MDREPAKVAKADHVFLFVVSIAAHKAAFFVLCEARLDKRSYPINLCYESLSRPRCLSQRLIVFALVHPDHVVFQLAKHALLDDPVIEVVKLLFDPITEFKVDFEGVLSEHLMEVNCREQVSPFSSHTSHLCTKLFIDLRQSCLVLCLDFCKLSLESLNGAINVYHVSVFHLINIGKDSILKAGNLRKLDFFIFFCHLVDKSVDRGQFCLLDGSSILDIIRSFLEPCNQIGICFLVSREEVRGVGEVLRVNHRPKTVRS